MKKILLLTCSCLFCMMAHSQSLTIKDMLHLKNQSADIAILSQKGFNVTEKRGAVSILDNAGTRERLILDNRGVVYATPDTAYTRSVLKDTKKQFKLIFKDPGPPDEYYQFAGQSLKITVSIGTRGHISIEKGG